MHVERTEGFEGLGLPDTAGRLPKAAATPSAGDQAAGSPDSAAEASFQPYIDRADGADAVRPDAVHEAKRLLAAGELDTPERARKAAENLLTFGI